VCRRASFGQPIESASCSSPTLKSDEWRRSYFVPLTGGHLLCARLHIQGLDLMRLGTCKHHQLVSPLRMTLGSTFSPTAAFDQWLNLTLVLYFSHEYVLFLKSMECKLLQCF